MGNIPDRGNSRFDKRPHRNSAVDDLHEICPQKILDVRMRIATGFYERPDVLLAAAGRILEQWDVPRCR